LAEQQPGDQHREDDLGQADERRELGAEDARGCDAREVRGHRGDQRQARDREHPADPVPGDADHAEGGVHGQRAHAAEREQDRRADAHAPAGQGHRRQVVAAVRAHHEVGGQPDSGSQSPQHPDQVEADMADHAEDERQAGQRGGRAAQGQPAGPLAVPDPHPGHHEDDAQVLEHERHADRQGLDGVEVEQLGAGHGDEAVGGDHGALPAQDVPPPAHRQPARHGQHQRGDADPRGHGGRRGPARVDQRLGQRA
jgi:hypothetical protein